MPRRFAASEVHSASLCGSVASVARSAKNSEPGSSKTPRQIRFGMPPEPCMAIGITYSSKFAARMLRLPFGRVWIEPFDITSTTLLALRRNSA